MARAGWGILGGIAGVVGGVIVGASAGHDVLIDLSDQALPSFAPNLKRLGRYARVR